MSEWINVQVKVGGYTLINLRPEFLIFDFIHLPVSAYYFFKPLTPHLSLLFHPQLLIPRSFFCLALAFWGLTSLADMTVPAHCSTLPSCLLIVRLPNCFWPQLSGPFQLSLWGSLIPFSASRCAWYFQWLNKDFLSPPLGQFLLLAPPGFLFANLLISPTFFIGFVILDIHVGCLVTGQERGGGICLSFRSWPTETHSQQALSAL